MAKTDLTIRFPNKTSRSHFIDWLDLKDTKTRYENYMDDIEVTDFKIKKLTVVSWVMDKVAGVVSTVVDRMTDLRAVNLS